MFLLAAKAFTTVIPTHILHDPKSISLSQEKCSLFYSQAIVNCSKDKVLDSSPFLGFFKYEKESQPAHMVKVIWDVKLGSSVEIVFAMNRKPVYKVKGKSQHAQRGPKETWKKILVVFKCLVPAVPVPSRICALPPVRRVRHSLNSSKSPFLPKLVLS